MKIKLVKLGKLKSESMADLMVNVGDRVAVYIPPMGCFFLGTIKKNLSGNNHKDYHIEYDDGMEDFVYSKDIVGTVSGVRNPSKIYGEHINKYINRPFHNLKGLLAASSKVSKASKSK